MQIKSRDITSHLLEDGLSKDKKYQVLTKMWKKHRAGFCLVAFKLDMNQKSPGWMLIQTVKTVDNSVNLGWGPIICISKEFPDDADVSGSGITLWKPLL